MRDHWRILGTLFKAWCVWNIVRLLLVLFWRPELAAEGGAPPPTGLAIAFAVAAAAAYWFTGARLHQHALQFRPHGIVLSALAMLAFPVGTLMGAYGLWVMVRRTPAGPASPPG